MGTNFYAIRRIKREDKDKLIEKAKELEEVIEKLSAYSVKTAVEDILEFLEDHDYYEIHLGKSSCGWQFLWNYNKGKYYQDNFESISEFLSEPDISVRDEYGRLYNVQEFLGKEIGHCILPGDELFTLKTYYDAHPEESRIGENDEWISSDGLRFVDHEFS